MGVKIDADTAASAISAMFVPQVFRPSQRDCGAPSSSSTRRELLVGECGQDKRESIIIQSAVIILDSGLKVWLYPGTTAGLPLV